MPGWIILAAVAALPVALREAAPTLGADRIVRVADVVATALPAAVARRIVLRVPAHKRTLRISRTALVSLVRRVAPDMKIASGEGDIAFVAPDFPRPEKAVIATPARPAIARGEAIRLVSTAGPVRIERAVTALQDASGPRIFVRDEDGQVFAVRIGATRVAEDAQ